MQGLIPYTQGQLSNFFGIKLRFIYLSISLYICLKKLIETVLLSTHNICLGREIKKSSVIHSYLGACHIKEHLTPRLSIASCSSLTISFPSTPSHLKPFVQFVSTALSKPSCRQGKENVKPRGRSLPIKLCSFINLKMHSAIWSNNWKRIQYLKFGNFHNNFIFTNSLKRHICNI